MKTPHEKLILKIKIQIQIDWHSALIFVFCLAFFREHSSMSSSRICIGMVDNMCINVKSRKNIYAWERESSFLFPQSRNGFSSQWEEKSQKTTSRNYNKNIVKKKIDFKAKAFLCH
jgi:hypothetical protein